jgi:hypothetical protein
MMPPHQEWSDDAIRQRTRSNVDPNRDTDTFTREAMYQAIGPFVEKHWPKNDTAADGGPATPRPGVAASTIAMFIVELDPEHGTVCEGTHDRHH